MSDGAKTGIALGAAAAAIIGAAFIAHKSHQHDNDVHYDDPNKEAEYERGYRDGLYNNAYHNYSSMKEYSDGYSAGVSQRRQNSSYSTGWGGYKPHVNVSDLEGHADRRANLKCRSGDSETWTGSPAARQATRSGGTAVPANVSRSRHGTDGTGPLLNSILIRNVDKP